MFEIFVGIDFGAKGGIAIIDHAGKILDLKYMPKDLWDIKGMLYDKYDLDLTVVGLEEQHPRPRSNIKSVATFHNHIGRVEQIIETMFKSDQIEYIVPSVWKDAMEVTADKQTSIDMAKKLFPGVNLFSTKRCYTDSDGMAEGLLVAEFLRRKHITETINV